MSREDLAEEIRKRMYGDYNSNEIDEDICEHCGNIIEGDPYEQMVPEHGGDSVHRVVWCDKSCKSNWLNEGF